MGIFRKFAIFASILIATHAAPPSTCADSNAPAEASDVLNSCPQCHGNSGAAIPGWPPIGTLSKERLISKLTGYRNQLNRESRMTDVTHDFSDEDIERIANHYARK